MNEVIGKKETLQRSIEHFKRNIQYIIDKKKTITDAEQLKLLDDEKKPKLAELKKCTDELKECVKKEKEEKKKANELKAVTRAIDSLTFGGAKKSKSQEAMEKAKRAKELREAAKKEYDEYLSQSAQYNQIDPPTVPGFLFLHEKIINAYGLCPFIRINVPDTHQQETQETHQQGDSSIIDDIEKNRKDWLRRQNDKGELYYTLYNQIVNKEDVMKWTELHRLKENEVDVFIHRNMSQTQFEIWENCKETASEYVGCAIKTKRIKEKYKMLVHTLSLLFAETEFTLHEYLTLKHDFNFVINELKRDNENSNKMDPHIHAILNDQFNSLLEEYKSAKENLEQATKYANNVYRNLQNEMYLFMMNKKEFGAGVLGRPQRKVAQQGKYYKKWTELSEEEKLERFESFAQFYIVKNMVQEKLLDEQDVPDVVAKLFGVIKTAFLEKKLVYRDFKWNVKAGIVDKVMCIKYDQDTCEFYINKKAEAPKPKNQETTKSKRKASVRTIVTKENERLINEEVLCYIVAKLQNHSQNSEDKPTIEKADKEECIERIKNKLHLKKVTANDKVIIGRKYEEIFNVVIANED